LNKVFEKKKGTSRRKYWEKKEGEGRRKDGRERCLG